jgi:hypothetical protein
MGKNTVTNSYKTKPNRTSNVERNFHLDLILEIQRDQSLDKKTKDHLLNKISRLEAESIKLAQTESIETMDVKEKEEDPVSIQIEITRINAIYKNNLKEIRKISGTYQRHDPRELIELMRQFSRESVFKYTTHVWDSKYSDYSNFIEALESSRSSLTKVNSLNKDFYQDVLYPFLYYKNEKNENKKKWGYYKLNIGWQYPPEMVKEFEASKDKPMAVYIPRSIRDRQYIPIYGTLARFEDYVDIFKNEIEFRKHNKSFMKSILDPFNASTEFKIHNREDVEKELEEVSDFYTYTRRIKDFMSFLYGNISNRKENRDIKIVVDTQENPSRVTVSITQLNSFANCRVDDDKVLLSADTSFRTSLKGIFSLCDISVESKFYLNREKRDLRLNYLHSEKEFIEQLPENSTEGYTTKITFYV